ncbi:O-antigen ligase family protein [Candidatus Methylomicrobium oryzae]|jgi:O-antigen ligase|uniref:O-antigen ligase family protein n=1 Tax=Candidatus Methylomicrobium oryzae TaxID=2802053 RepID=UPI001921A316|nr:O-antigen ligase family protein [Methylomicrobium sp. RS1]MBL1262366.1 O-antigen ligase family protein [Methylomicrobium sp. RS1]
MLSISILILTLIAGIKYPGVLLSGLYFGYTVSAISEVPGVTSVYALCAVSVLAFKHVRERSRIALNKLDVAFLLFLIWHSASVIWVEYPNAEVEFAVDFLLPAISVYASSRLLASLPLPEIRILEVIYGFCLIGAVISYLVVAQGDMIYGRLRINSASVVGLSQPLPYVILSAIALLLGQRKHTLYTLALSAAAIILAGYLTFLTGTRGALIAVAAGYMALTYISAGCTMRRLKLRSTALVMVALILFISFDLGISEDGTLSRIFNFQSYGSSEDTSSQERLELYLIAYELFMDSPLIGSGLGAFSFQSYYPYPHNIWLEIAAASGVVGLVLFAIVIILVFRRIRYTGLLMLGWQGPTLVALIIAGFIHHQVSFDLSQAKSLFTIGFIAGYGRMKVEKNGAY